MKAWKEVEPGIWLHGEVDGSNIKKITAHVYKEEFALDNTVIFRWIAWGWIEGDNVRRGYAATLENAQKAAEGNE